MIRGRRCTFRAWLGMTCRRGLALLLAVASTGTGASAQQPAAAASAASDNGGVTERLIQLLVKNGVLTKEQANSLLEEARQEARQAPRGKAANNRAAAVAAAPTQAGAAPSSAAAPAPAEAPGTVHVTYVPQMVRDEIAAEVKQQVMQEAQEQGWATPNQIPDWVTRTKVFGDLRLRGERDLLPGSNFNAFPDFNAINMLPNGFDTASGLLPPLLNSTEDRTRFRIRARLGIETQLDDWVTGTIRIGTGNDRNPVSENQTLGQGGDFSKYSVWLDWAYLKMRPFQWMNVYAGRFPNPFWTTPLLFYDELNFDGLAVQARYDFTRSVSGFITGGAFPLFNTEFNFGSTNLVKTASHDAYLTAVQGGAEWKITKDYDAKLAVGYFAFNNVQGNISSPCLNPTAFGSCNTDDQVPGWVQFGNTLFPLRNIIAQPTATSSTGPQPQFFGLASKFNVLDIKGEFTLTNFHPIDVVLTADFVENLGFNRTSISSRGPVNNFGNQGTFQAGNNGYLGQITVGHQQLEKKWDWNFSLGYRYLETDAVLDALNDSDFHLGGTNAKGYTVVGNLALNKNVWMDAKWLSATQVSGQPYTANVLLVDLNAKF
jgi:hypothetical protein